MTVILQRLVNGSMDVQLDYPYGKIIFSVLFAMSFEWGEITCTIGLINSM